MWRAGFLLLYVIHNEQKNEHDFEDDRRAKALTDRTSNQASNRTSNPLDEFYKKHLFRWADSYFIHPDERDEAIEEITRQVEADPDLLEGPHGGPSWTEIWEFIERESTRNLTRNSIDDEDKDMWKGKSYVRRSYKSTDFPEKAGWYGPDLWLWRNNTLTLVYSRPVVNPLGLKSGLKPGSKLGSKPDLESLRHMHHPPRVARRSACTIFSRGRRLLLFPMLLGLFA